MNLGMNILEEQIPITIGALKQLIGFELRAYLAKCIY